MKEAVAGRRSARVWRITGGVLAGLLILAALALAGLRIMLATVPGHADRIQAWVERQTRLRIEFARLDARLRWFGPEIVLEDVHVLDRDGTQALFATREGSVGLDVWNFFRTGQLVAGRVRFAGPDVTVVRLPDGRIRLVGQRERPADEPPFDLDRLPAGRVQIEDATVTYRDLKTGRGPWRIQHLDVTLQRDRDFVTAQGRARLPEALGGRIDFTGRLQGSLMHFAALSARVEARVDEVRLTGWKDFLPDSVATPTSGQGPVAGLATFVNGKLRQARVDMDLTDVALTLPVREVPAIETVTLSAPYREPGESPLRLPTLDKTFVAVPAPGLPRTVRYGVLGGTLRLRRDGEDWIFRANDLKAYTGEGRRAAPMQFSGALRGNLLSTYGLRLDAGNVGIAQLWPLALAFAPRSFDRWSGLAPTGTVRSLHLEMLRERAGSEPKFIVSADVADVGVQPTGSAAGVSGVTATFSGTNEHGRVALRAGPASFSLPRLFRAPITVQRATADAEWRRDGTAWVLDAHNVAVEHSLARARGQLQLTVPGGRESPVLVASAQVDGADTSIVREVLPVGRMKPRTIGWFDGAFVKGEVKSGQLSYRGPVHEFPFRGGEGDFTATADVRNVTLDYFDGFAPLTEGEGTVVFHNAGVVANVRSGLVGGLRLTRGEYSVADFKSPLMRVEATASGDVGRAFTFLQTSPLGPRLGSVFMGLGGQGPADYQVSLALPTGEARQDERDYRVRAQLNSVTVTLAALRAPAQRVTGDFELHNLEARATSLRGTMLDGPFEVTVAPAPGGGDVTAAIGVAGHGRAAGALLPAFIGLPATIRMSGAADWELSGRFEQHRTGEHWVTRFDVASSLAGLGIDAPQPFAKPAPDARPTRVGLEFSAPGRNDISVDTGTARARLRFVAGANGKWALERGTARFDGQAVTLPSRPGLVVGGDWPQFDLAEWLALGAGAGAGTGTRLADWLGPVDVHLDRARVVGFEFRDVTARLRSVGDTWQVGVSGPMAEGQVTVPEDLAHGRPITLEMKRLVLESPPAKADTKPAESDPRSVPALSVRAEDFTWQSHRFGRVLAIIDKDPLGLRFTTLSATAPDFSMTGTGSWLQETAGARTRLEMRFDSKDLGAAARALGYRDAIEARDAKITASVNWAGGPSGDALTRLDGKLHIELGNGQLLNVKPGAGRLLGLLSVGELPRRLSLDFRDVTEKGLAFHKVTGDFDLRDGDAYTQNLLMKGPAVDVGVVGRTGLRAEDYDQTIVVSGNPSGPLAVAGALAAGPVIGAGVLVFSELFKGQLQGLTRAYYRVSGPWSNPVVERIAAPATDVAAQPEGTAPGAKQ